MPSGVETDAPVAPWWSLKSSTAAYLDAHPAPWAPTLACREVDGRWALDAPAPTWFEAAFKLHQIIDPSAWSMRLKKPMLFVAGSSDVVNSPISSSSCDIE